MWKSIHLHSLHKMSLVQKYMNHETIWVDFVLTFGQRDSSDCRALCLKPKVTKTSTHEWPLTAPLFHTVPFTAPPLWVPSIFLGKGTKAKQPVPHRAVSHRQALTAPAPHPSTPPPAQPRDSFIVWQGTTEKREKERRRQRMRTLKCNVAKG